MALHTQNSAFGYLSLNPVERKGLAYNPANGHILLARVYMVELHEDRVLLLADRAPVFLEVVPYKLAISITPQFLVLCLFDALIRVVVARPLISMVRPVAVFAPWLGTTCPACELLLVIFGERLFHFTFRAYFHMLIYLKPTDCGSR